MFTSREIDLAFMSLSDTQTNNNKPIESI
jgi:hypothetical protein